MARRSHGPATIGAQARQEEPDHHYPTPPCLLQAMPVAASRVAFWEPAAGDGRLAREIASRFPVPVEILRSDLKPQNDDLEFDFLEPGVLRAPFGMVDTIITNPPFSHLGEFITRGLQHLRAGHARTLTLLARHEADTTQDRTHLFAQARTRVVCPWRARLIPGTKGTGRYTFDWWTWTADHQGPPITIYSPLPDIAIRRNPA